MAGGGGQESFYHVDSEGLFGIAAAFLGCVHWAFHVGT